jgi:hypothetical protein
MMLQTEHQILHIQGKDVLLIFFFLTDLSSPAWWYLHATPATLRPTWEKLVKILFDKQNTKPEGLAEHFAWLV